jgi:hypothetical protein
MRKLGSLRSLNPARVALLLVAVVLMTAAMMLPASSHAAPICCGATVHYAYFTDASYTTLTGSCTINAFCVGGETCSGTKTAYYTVSSTCCPRCSE